MTFDLRLLTHSTLSQNNLLTFNPKAGDQLSQYENHTQLWSKKINLTANLSKESYFRENILDPLTSFKIFYENILFKTDIPTEGFFIDVGCGGGFTGLTWNIIFPDLPILLVDSDRKKINFCKDVIRLLGLKRARAEWFPIQEYNKHLKDNVHGILSRAVWSPEELLNHTRHLLHNKSPLISLATQEQSQKLNNPWKIYSYPSHSPLNRTLAVWQEEEPKKPL